MARKRLGTSNVKKLIKKEVKMKCTTLSIILIIVVIISAVCQGLVLNDTRSALKATRAELQATEADLDELGGIVFAMGTADVDLTDSLDRQIEIWGMINSEMVWSVWQLLYWDDEEGYNDCMDRISTLHEELINFETQWRERVTYKMNLLAILEGKWER